MTSETHMSHQGLAGRFGHGKGTYSADFQKCPGWESRRFSLGSFSSMSISWVKLGLSCRSKAQQADRISCGQRRVSGWELAEREEGTLQPLHRAPQCSQGPRRWLSILLTRRRPPLLEERRGD